jgi:PAS domain S-box-containing protein
VARAPTTPPSILVVDDNVINQRLIAAALEGEGFSLLMACDGEQALASAHELHPQLILLDLELPEVNGLEVTRRLKADPSTCDIVVIAVTASTGEVDRERALGSGCDGYLSKPIDPIRLPSELARYLAPDRQPASEPTAAVAPHRILVVEDNPTTRKMVRVALESHGYAVIEAADCRTALDQARERRPDLILQDLILPDMDGFELLRRLRELPEGEEIPILCLSGFVSRLDEARAMRALHGGFAAVLVKPVDPIQLLEIVRIHLEKPAVLQSELGQGHRILVIDDDPLQRRLAEHYLSSSGFRVTTAADGREALELARRSIPDAIISDILMPGMDGFQLCLAVRADPSLAKVPVVLVSSHYLEEVDKTLAMKVGASTLVPRSEDLGAAMRAVVEALATGEQPRPIDVPGAVREEMLGRTAAQLERQFRHNAQLGQQCLMQAAQLSVLAGVTDALARNATLSGVLGDVLAACLDMAGISKGALFLRAGSELKPQHWIGFSEAERGELARFFGDHDLFARVTSESATVSLPSPGPSLASEEDFLARAGIAAALLVPVRWGQHGYGVLFLGARTTEVGGEDPVAFARVLGAQMGQAIGLAEAFERLQASEEKFRALSDAIDDRVIVLDRRRRAVGVYGRWTGKDGWSRDQILNQPIEDILGPDTQGVHASAHDRAFAGESVVYEWSGEHDGQTKFEQTIVSPIRDGKGEVTAIVRVSRDVTEQKRTQAQLMVSDRLASVGMLAAGVAHEINNPLAAVTANLEMAAQELAGLPGNSISVAILASLRESIGDASEGAERVRQIVRDLKLFSRSEENERRCAVDVEQVVESSLRMAWNEVRHRAHVVKDYGVVPMVLANESRLGQVFLNLLVNAAQALPPGRADSNEIGLGVALDVSGQVAVEVRDTGAGMPPEVLKKLFTPFFTTKPRGVGTGLGLNICQRIVTELGGTMTVTSVVGQGTTFRVLLPASSEPRPAEKSGEQRLMIAPLKRGRILVIDDDLMICAAVQRTLSPDHDVVVVMDARIGMEHIRRGERFDAILCDLMMPVVTGMEFYRDLLEFSGEQAARVVFFTGAAYTVGAREFLDRVPNACVEKPFRIHRLRSVINQHLAT